MGQILEAQRVDERQKESLLHELHEGRQKEIDKIKERQILEQEIRKRLDFRHCNEIALDYKVDLVSKELNHLAAILHVYVGGLNFMK